MGIFDGFSRRPEPDSGALQKRDSGVDLGVRISGFFTLTLPLEGFADSLAARDPPGIDVENFAGGADVGERRGIGAGHPDLRAEFC
jgi:hypothetical protein